MIKKIKQTITFGVEPEVIYEVLMDSKKHTKFTGSKAVISKKVGGNFSVYDGYAEGKNLELKPSKLIVQSWRASDWPQNHYSTVTFSLKKSGKNTKLTFTQDNIPENELSSIKKGWIDYYWNPMKEMFARNKKM